MLAKSKLDWSSIFVGLLGVILLCIGQDNSFVPFSFHGLCWRILTFAALLIWLLLLKEKKNWAKVWSLPIWWAWCGLCLFQVLVSLSASTLGFALNFLEGRFWISIVFMLVVDALSMPGAKVWLKRCIGASFVLGVLYGYYQIWIALPHLRSSVGSMIEMGSELHKERFMLRLNSDEMFGTRLYSNLFGLFACVGFFSVASKVKLVKNPLRLVLLTLFIVALIYSESKGATLVGLSAASLWAFIYLKERFKLSWLWLIPLMVVGVLFLYLMKAQLYASVKIRLDYWQVALKMLSENPLGVGALNFSEYYGTYMHAEATEVKMTHNDHLQFFCEFGYLGGLLHVTFISLLLMQSFKLYKTSKESEVELVPFIWKGWLAFGVYLMITCVGMSMGPWDLPLHGFPWILLCLSIVAWLTHKTKCFDSAAWSFWGVFLVALHAFIDMPLYDHSLMALIFVALLCELPVNHERTSKYKSWFAIGAVVALGVSVLAIQRYQHLLISDWMGLQKEWKAPELLAQTESYQFDHQSIEPIYRSWVRQSEPKLDANEDQWLKRLVELRPMNSGYALQMAEKLSPSKEAERWFREAYVNHPQQPRYAFHFGEYLYQIGKKVESKKMLELALQRHAEAQILSEQNDDFLLHLLQAEHVQKARELIRD